MYMANHYFSRTLQNGIKLIQEDEFDSNLAFNYICCQKRINIPF
jgi:hypothetical protein